jgi:hypothetical protein
VHAVVQDEVALRAQARAQRTGELERGLVGESRLAQQDALQAGGAGARGAHVEALDVRRVEVAGRQRQQPRRQAHAQASSSSTR